jgi:hypothetical protein
MTCYEERCSSHLNCSANICPLDPDIVLRSHIQGDKICRHVLDHLEGKTTPFDSEIIATKEIWMEKYGEGNLARRIKSRQNVRRVVWKKL